MKIQIETELVREIVSDVGLVAGVAAAGWGFWQLGEPFAWIFGGFVLIALGYRTGRGGR